MEQPNTGLEESMSRLGLRGSSHDCQYPERPGEQICSYFIRTGYCGYGMKCRFNHPREHGFVSNPERVGQPVCEYFLKNGTCKFGSRCKYHHPRQEVESFSLNYHGYPLHQGEKECPYYVRTGQCKFGLACRFDHPQPVYQMVQPPPTLYPSFVSWQARGPPMLPASHMAGSYGHVMFSPTIAPVPVLGWSPYPHPGGQQLVPAGLSPPQQPFPPISINHEAHFHKESNTLPEKPERPVCQYYMKRGVCKFGTMCKYNHPQDSNTQYS